MIRDEEVRSRAIETARDAVARAGFEVVDGVDCRVTGPKGNREHLLFARRDGRLATQDASSEAMTKVTTPIG